MLMVSAALSTPSRVVLLAFFSVVENLLAVSRIGLNNANGLNNEVFGVPGLFDAEATTSKSRGRALEDHTIKVHG